MLSVIGIGLRALLLLIAAVVLGLSVTLAKRQVIGSVPAETSFSTFAGAVGFFASTLGMAAMWFERVNSKVLMAIDTLVAILYLTGAISLMVAMKNINSCTSTDNKAQAYRYLNKIINGGCKTAQDTLPLCPKAITSDGKDDTTGPCQMAQADYIFMAAGFIFGLAMIFMVYLLARRGRGGTPVATSRRARPRNNTPIPHNAYA
ncbi:hypothetical protein HD806DRAFT_534985 [Xylariaceae sp. AK1471]|nr:hypothetical protein HD806DRAFT_534985 [Xylariaceae sp. AK1471]